MKQNREESQRRSSLVDAAYAIIASLGMEGLRTRDVAKRAGIHHATLHYYFPTKDDLVNAVADRVDEEFLAVNACIWDDGAAGLGFIEKLRLMFGTFLKALGDSPDRFLVVSELLLYARRQPATMALLRRPNRGEEHLFAFLEAAIARGEIRSDINVKTTAHCLIGFSMGLSMLMAKHPESVPEAVEEFLRMQEAYLIADRLIKSQPSG